MILRSKSFRSRLVLTTALAGGLLLPAAALAQTTNGVLPNAGDATFAPGQVTITGGGPTAGSTLNVAVNQPTAVIDWFHFDVPAGDTVNFSNNSLASTAAVLNRVRAGGAAVAAPSVINGTINAPNVEVWLQNPDGMLFGAGVAINAAGFVATAADVAAPDFGDGDNVFRFLAPLTSTARISGGGAGARFTTTGGKLAFIAPAVAVEGAFNAGAGSVAFVTATDVTMTANPGSPLGLTVNAGTSVGGDAQVVNGTVNGGEAYFVLASRSSVVDALLNVGAAVTASGAVANGRGVTLVAGAGPVAAPGVSFTGAPSAVGGVAGIRQTGAISASGPGQQVTLAASGSIVGSGAIVGNGNVVASTSAALTLGDISSTTGSAGLFGTSVTADDVVAGTTATISASSGPIALGTVTGGGNVAINGASGSAVAVTGAVRSTAGAVTVEGTGAVSLGSIDAAGPVAVGAVVAPASLTIAGPASGSSLQLRTAGALKTGALLARTGAINATAASMEIVTATATTGPVTLTTPGAIRSDAITAGSGNLLVTGASLSGLTAAGTDLTATAGLVRVVTTGAAVMDTVAASGLIEATGSAVTVGDVTGGDRLTLTTTGGALRVEGNAVVAGNVALTAVGPAAISSVTSTGGTIALNASGAVTGLGTAGGDLTAAGTVTALSGAALSLDALAGTTVTARGLSASVGSATATAGDAVVTATAGDASLGGGGASRDVLLTATGVAQAAGDLAVGRDYRISAANIVLGAGTQRVGRQAVFVASSGSITGGSGLTLIGDGDGVGAGNSIILDAASGGISLAGSRLLGGDARTSDVALRTSATAPLVLGDVAARSLGLTSGAYGPVSPIVHGADITTGDLATTNALSITATNGDITAGTIQTFAPLAGVTLSATGAGGDIRLVDIVAPGAVTLTATDISVRNVTVADAGAGLTANAAGALSISGDAVAAGNVLLTSGGATELGSVTSTAGLIDMAAVGAISGVGAAGGDLSAAGTLDIVSDAAITLDALRGTIVTVTGASAAIGSADATAGDVSVTATAGNASLRGGSASNDILISATGTAAASGNISAARDYLITGADVSFGAGTQRAGRLARAIATTGSITGGFGLTLTGDGDNAGIGNAIILDAANGAISLAGSGLFGGDARSSDVALRAGAGNPLVLGDVAARELGVTDAAYGAVAPIAHDAAITLGNLDSTNAVSIGTTSGPLRTGNIRAYDVGATVDLTASGPGGNLAVGNVRAPGSVTLYAAERVDAASVVAESGSIAITAAGGGITAGVLDAATDLSLTAAADLMTGPLSVTGGDATLVSTAGGVLLGSDAAIGGDLRIAGNFVGLGAGAAAETISAGGIVDITARNGWILGGEGLTLRSDSAGLGNRNVFLDATGGDIYFAPTSTIQAGPGGTSSIGIRLGTSGRSAAFGNLRGTRIAQVDAAHALLMPVAIAGSFTATGNVASAESFDVSAGAGISLGDVRVTNPGATIGLLSGGVLTARSLTAGGPVTATATGANAIGSVTSGGAVAVRGGAVAVGTAAAGGALDIQATSGALSLGTGTSAAGTTLTSTGALTVSNSVSGATRISITAGGPATIRDASSSGGPVGIAATSATVGTASTGAVLDIVTSSGPLALGNGTAATRANLSSSGALSVAGTLTAGTNATVTAGGQATIGTIRGTSGAVSIDATSATVTTAAAGTSLAINARAGDINLTSGTAGTTGRLTATGDATVGGGGLTTSGLATVTAANARLNSVRATNGSVEVTTTGATTGVSGGRANLSAAGAGNDVRVTAGGGVLLGTVTAADEVSLRGSSVDVTTATATVGALGITATAGNAAIGTGTAGTSVSVSGTGTVGATRLVAGTTLGVTSGGAMTIGSAQAGGAATLDAGGAATLGAVLAGPTLSIRATDATITGTQRAGRVTITNRTPASTALRLGDGTVADGFRLSAAELGFMETDALTLDGGSGAVEIGTLAFNAATGRNNVDIWTTGRIDVRGTVTGAGNGRLFRFGGSAANVADRASSILIASTASAGGRLLFSTADLELRGTRIAQGQSAGFLDALAPLSPADVTTRFISNPGSSLYSASVGGVPYDAANTTTLSANRLTVRYSDYALFQNTGDIGENLGAVINTVGGSGPSITIIGNGATGGIGGVALFGRVNGIAGLETALLGPSVVSATNFNARAGRINGCLINSGGGCITNVVAQPALNVFDASRTQILRAGENLAVPFDPVVGTNNEALFSGVSSIDVPVDEAPPPPQCPDGSTDPNCPPKQETQP